MSFINTVFGIPLGYVMWGCYQLVKNYGLSIILFTLVSKIVMLPHVFATQIGIYYGTEKQYSNDTDPATDK